MQVNAPLTEKTWGRDSVVWVVNKKWLTFHSFQEQGLGEIIAKSMARTARTQLKERHLEIWRVFGELYNPKRALSKMNLTSMEVTMF